MNALLLLKRYDYNFLPMLKYSRLFSTLCRSVLYLSAIHCTRVLFPIKRHGIRKQRPYANAFLLYAAKFFFWSVCHWSNFELSTDDQHWNGCSRQKRGAQCIYNFLFSFHFLHIPTFVNFRLSIFLIEYIPILYVSKMVDVATPTQVKNSTTIRPYNSLRIIIWAEIILFKYNHFLINNRSLCTIHSDRVDGGGSSIERRR